MTTDDAKTYLSKREIPRLFESLMTGLMYHRPADHIKYLIDCLQKVHDKGQDNITWSSFVDIRRTKTPLPPISGNDKRRPSSKGSRPTSRTRTPPKGDESEAIIQNQENNQDSMVDRVVSPDLAVRSSPLQNRRGSDASDHSCQEEKPQQQQQPGKKSPPLPAISNVSLPDIPLVLVMGAPGSMKDKHVENVLKRYPDWKHLKLGTLIKTEITKRGEASEKWKMTRDIMSRGEVAPEDVTIEVLVEALQGCKKAKGAVITGFPRNIEQVMEYEKQVSRVDTVFMIDCDETKATERLLRKGKTSNKPEDSMSAIATRLNYFKAHTLAAAKYYDDQGKLIILDGDAGEDTVTYEVGKAFDNLFLKKYGSKAVGPPPKKESGIPDAPTYKKKYEESDDEEEEEKPLFVGPVPMPPTIATEDTGRKPGVPEGPIIFVAGGPGSGKGTQCARIIERYPDMVHLSMGDIIRTEISSKGTSDEKWGMITQLVSKGDMAPEEVTIDLLKEQLLKHKDAKAYLVEGFPRDKSQVEAFNKVIGGLNFVVLFDCEEYYMQMRLLKRGKESGRIDDNMSAISRRLEFYKYNTLPVMKYFDDQKKLVVLNADRDREEMFYDLATMFDFAFYGRKPGETVKSESKALPPKPKSTPARTDKEINEAAVKIQAGFRGFLARKEIKKNKASPETDDDKDKKPAPSDEPAKEEVVEETIAPAEASTTGDSVENPSHSKALEDAAKS